jgi:uncharacterized protein (TIGR02996 family)
MPPPGYEPFLRAICDSPADDAPRLVYADWLEEHGDPFRAEFIRVQIARAASQSRNEDVADLMERERVHRGAFEIRWRCELPVLSGVTWHRFWRGFLSRVDFATGRWFVKQSDRARTGTPIQFVRLFGLSDFHMPRIAGSQALKRVEELTFVDPGGISFVGWRDFATAKHLDVLQSLRIIRRPTGSPQPLVWPYVIDLREAVHLLRAPFVRQLREVRITGSLQEHTADLFRQRLGSRFRHDWPP